MNIKKFGAIFALVLALGMTTLSVSPALADHHGWGGYRGGWGYGHGYRDRGWGGGIGSFAAGAALGGLLGGSLGGYYDSPYVYPTYSDYSPYYASPYNNYVEVYPY